MNDYQPIACAFYDIFEIAIMRGHRLRTRWRDPDGTVAEEWLQPLELRIHHQAEHLLATREDGSELELRLDWIESAAPDT